MIKTTKKETVKYILELDESEARWLAGLMQNPIFEDEEYQEAEMRHIFFNAVKDALDPRKNKEISYTDFEEEQ